MEKMKERKIVVAVDESQESMYALSWCITNLVSDTNKLVLLYVKPPSAFYSLDAAGYFINDTFLLCIHIVCTLSYNHVLQGIYFPMMLLMLWKSTVCTWLTQ